MTVSRLFITIEIAETCAPDGDQADEGKCTIELLADVRYLG